MTLLPRRASDLRRLLLVGTAALAAIALSHDYVAAAGSAAVFLSVIGAGLLLALAVAVPVLFADR